MSKLIGFTPSVGPFDLLEYTFDVDNGDECKELIRTAYEEIAGLVLSGQGQELANRFNLCNAVDTDSTADVAALYENSIRAVLYYLDTFQ